MPAAEQFLDERESAEGFLDATSSADAFLDTPSASTRAYVPGLREDVRAQPALNLLELEQRQLQEQRAYVEGAAREREAGVLTPEQTARLDSADPAQVLMHPPPGLEAPHITGEDVLKQFPTLSTGTAKIIAGIAQSAEGAWNFMASPVGVGTTALATMAGAPGLLGLAGKATLGTFALESLKALPDVSNALDAAVREGDPEAIAREASNLTLTLGVALGAGKGALEPMAAPRLTESAAREPSPAEVAAPEAPKPPPVDALTPSTEPAPASLGIAPEGTSFAQRAIDYFKPPTPDAPPEVRIDRQNILPRLQPYEAEKAIASRPEGMARVPVLGALVDPRATIDKPGLFRGEATLGLDEALITRSYSINKGRTLAALWAESQRRNHELYNAAEDGTISLVNGERGYISDVIEAEIRDPGSQRITDAQRAWINDEWLPLLDDFNKMLQEEGVREVVVAEPEGGEMRFRPGTDYFPRPAIGKRGVPEAKPTGPGGGRPGSTPFSEKPRYYETEFEGARPALPWEQKREIIYDPNAISRVTKLIIGGYKAVADHRLANDPALQGVTRRPPAEIVRERMSQLESTIDFESGAPAVSKNDLAAIGKELEAQLEADAAYGGIRMWGEFEEAPVAPAFRNKIFPRAVANKLRAAYADDIRGWVKATENINTAGKAFKAALDVSAPMVQGAAMLGTNPAGWARSTLRSYQALFDPDVLSRVLERDGDAVVEFSQSGGSLLRLEDFLQGQGADVLQRFSERLTTLELKAPNAKVVAKPLRGYLNLLERTGRAYGTFLDLAKLELWKAWAPLTERKDWPRLAESIENTLFMGRMEATGLNPRRTLGERLLLFAPAYYRGAGNFVANALMRDVSGKMARRGLAGYATASLLLTVGSWFALGLSEEEMRKRLDPRRGSFMKVPIETGDGRRVEVGFGNILTQVARLLGQTADYAFTDRKIGTGTEGNPWLRFSQGRAATLPSTVFEIYTGRDYMGNDIGISETLARRFLPFAVESLLPREEGVTKPQRVMDAVFSFAGLNAFPESEYASQLRRMDVAAEAKHGAPVFNLPLRERARAVQEFQSSTDYKKREPTLQDMRRYAKLDMERRERLRSRLNKETRATLDQLGLDPGTYRSTITLGGVDVPLSRAEQTRYEELLVESFDKHLARIPAEAAKATPQQRAKWWEDYAAAIRKEAREKLMTELAKPRKE